MPLTFTDMVLRSKVEYGIVRTLATHLSNEGLVCSKRIGRLTATKEYELTGEAQRLVLKGMMG